MSVLKHSLGGLVGFLIDRGFGEPPTQFHPVVWLGNGLIKLEAKTYRDSRASGCLHLAVATTAGLSIGYGTRKLLGPVASTAMVTAVATAGRMLGDSAAAIAQCLATDDLDGARSLLPSLVGRDPNKLDEAQIARAVIESVAENTVDAVTASLMLASLGGAPAVAAHRVVNTLDAMIGHRTQQYAKFGWASAKVDDALAFVPARLTLAAIALSTPSRAKTVFSIARRDAAQHPSPNGGVVEAGFAAALDVTLGGVNEYEGVVEDRGELGDGGAPVASDIERAVSLARRVGTLVAVAPFAVSMSKALSTAAKSAS